MSGVSGSDRINRKDFKKVLNAYKKVISKFPGFESVEPSGSYNSDMSKNDFGDMDLIVTIKTSLDKKALKKELADFFAAMPDDIVIPFNSEKYKGRKLYNSGEIITVQFPQGNGKTVQIDSIIALDKTEADFKKQFLDMTAQKQGLIIGLVKVVLLEGYEKEVFDKIGFKPEKLDKDQEYAFNISSSEIQLRKVTYEPGTLKEKTREVVWTSRDWNVLKDILFKFNLDLSFEDLVKEVKPKIKNPRSAKRIHGLFSSMVSIKSGEVGTNKGAVKQKALDLIQKTFNESVISQSQKSLVELFNRLNT